MCCHSSYAFSVKMHHGRPDQLIYRHLVRGVVYVCVLECQEQLRHLPCLIISTLYKWSPSGHYLHKKRTEHSKHSHSSNIRNTRERENLSKGQGKQWYTLNQLDQRRVRGLGPVPGVENEIFGRSGFNKTLITYPQKLPHLIASFLAGLYFCYMHCHSAIQNDRRLASWSALQFSLKNILIAHIACQVQMASWGNLNT